MLDAWGILYIQTTRVLLGAYLRPRIRLRALRAPSLDPRTFPNVALRAVRLALVELAIIVWIKSLILALHVVRLYLTRIDSHEEVARTNKNLY